MSTMDSQRIRQVITSQCHTLKPFVFTDMISSWPASQWIPQFFAHQIPEKQLRFRIGKKAHQGVQWETGCHYEDATVGEFLDWLDGKCHNGNPLSGYDREMYWCYADYKYMAKIFMDHPDILKAVDWSVFGFDHRDGTDSTWWLGSEGAYTVCHYDTYGCNLVAQIHGRKRWTLFPPEDSPALYPTRLPYEESSVFSQVDIMSPDLKQHPDFSCARPYLVTLEPGQVLFVPRHWWHHVVCLETSISVNSWIELESDKEIRLHEAVTRLLACSLMSQYVPASKSGPHTPSVDQKAGGSDGFSPSRDFDTDVFLPCENREVVSPSSCISSSVVEGSGSTDSGSKPCTSQEEVGDFVSSSSQTFNVNKLASAEDKDESMKSFIWLNPTEELTSASQNMAYIKVMADILQSAIQEDATKADTAMDHCQADEDSSLSKRQKMDETTLPMRKSYQMLKVEGQIFTEEFDKRHIILLKPGESTEASGQMAGDDLQAGNMLTERDIIDQILQPDVIDVICKKIKKKCKIK